MKILWDQSESNAPLEIDEAASAEVKAFFKRLHEELEAEELEEDYEDEEE